MVLKEHIITTGCPIVSKEAMEAYVCDNTFTRPALPTSPVQSSPVIIIAYAAYKGM